MKNYIRNLSYKNFLACIALFIFIAITPVIVQSCKANPESDSSQASIVSAGAASKSNDGDLDIPECLKSNQFSPDVQENLINVEGYTFNETYARKDGDYVALTIDVNEDNIVTDADIDFLQEKKPVRDENGRRTWNCCPIIDGERHCQ